MATTKASWFEVDREGLAKLRASVPKSSLVFELIQNCWDTNASSCRVSLSPASTRGRYILRVEDDDPEGFKDLSHAWTIFAESGKKNDANKRGRFNLGEKLVLAMCRWASIETTTGTVIFKATGERTRTQKKTLVGSVFTGEISMTKEEFAEVAAAVATLIPPCPTSFNGEPIRKNPCLKTFEAVLPTVIGEDLRPSKRKTTVSVYEAAGPAMVYEMGIPVVETGDKYHVDVHQKVPLTMDRQNVTPAFLRELREAVAEHMRDQLTQEDANQTWVRVAAANPEASRELVETVFKARFGEKAVIYDPSDMEANKVAMDKGYTVVMGGHLSKQEWENVRTHGIVAPAGKVFTNHKVQFDPNGREMRRATITEGMGRVETFALWLAERVLGCSIAVEFVSEMTIPNPAFWTNRRLTFNVARTGKAFFDRGLDQEVLDTIIHEFAHHYSGDHMTREFSDACTRIGSRVTLLALTEPEPFKEAML